jgi:hypothetical protein
MIKRLPLLALVIVFLLHVGCARPKIQLDRVLVYNATNETITDVQIRHEPTNRVGGVSLILPGKSLDIGFPRQPMLARKGTLGWRDGAGKTWQVELALPYDYYVAEEGRAMALVYMISPSGIASVSLR